jgi:DNA repair photolyase
MPIIYEPTGKAREYSPLAANFYDGCDHGCAYCYAPGIRRRTRENYTEVVTPRKDIIRLLEIDAKKIQYSKKQVLFNFMGDPYCKENDSHKITWSALEIMLENHVPVAILTKGGNRSLQDQGIIKRFGEHIKIGATLTFFDPVKSNEWEPGAASPQERLDMLRYYHSIGVKTWASFEPVIDPKESIKLIKASIDFVDEYKIGKINNFGGIDKTIDWTAFLREVVSIIRSAGKKLYIKIDLREASPSIALTAEESNYDAFGVTPWDEPQSSHNFSLNG